MHSLYVEGSAIAEEIFVKLKADWPDFVFDGNYDLMPLYRLEAYILKNGRLPEMPSAEEVEKEGVRAGETIRILTMKVEELTLYILQLQKEMELLKESLQNELKEQN